MCILARSLLITVCLTGPPGMAAAQPGLPPVERMLHVFEEDGALDRSGGTEGIVAVQRVMVRPQVLAPAALDSLLAGLERLALDSEHRRTRVQAVIQLARIRDEASFDRLMRVYRASAAHPEVRDMIVGSLHVPPSRRAAWIAHLRRVVVQPANAEDYPRAAFDAMFDLQAMDEPGRQALRDIHRRGLARQAAVRALLAEWVRNGFRLQFSAPG